MLYKRKINSYEWSTVIIVMVLQLQVFRRLSTVGYTFILLLAYLYWFSSLRFSKRITSSKSGVVFLVFYCILPVLSLITMPLQEFSQAFLRYGALFPFIVICILYPQIVLHNIKPIITVYCLVVVASAILMVYQIPFGRISFFADDTAGRLGYERYGSLMGSTTTYGTASLAAIIAIHCFKPFKRVFNYVAELLVLVGGILCLSKAFFVNTALAYVLIVIFSDAAHNKKISSNQVFILVLSIIVLLLGLLLIINKTFVGNYFNDMWEYTFSENDLGISTSLFNRLYSHPLEAFQYHNHPWFYYLLMGVGFKGYSGVLGLPNYPMCHNNYLDIVLAQGLPALASLISIYILSLKKAFIGESNDKAKLVKQLVPYILINMLAGQWIYLSVSGSLFLVIINSYIVERSEYYD